MNIVPKLMSSNATPSPADTIPLSVPAISGNEWKYIKECLDTGWVSSVGAYVERFERDMCAYVGTTRAIAASTGTAALHIALLVAGVQPEDEVLVSTLTFIAPANAIRYTGAWPVFVDAEPRYWQMDTEKAVDFIEKECHWRAGVLYNRESGRRVKAILPVHILGHPVDMDPILDVARKYNLAVIEDATESLGGKYKGRMVGNLGDIACFSFNGNKIITTGGGGMIVTNNHEWATRARYLTTQAKDDPLDYIHNEIGYNYRLTNIQAAMGCAQMEQLKSYVQRKRDVASVYRGKLRKTPGITAMCEAEWASCSFWLYTILVDEVQYGMDSRFLLRKLSECSIQTRPLWQPLHLSLAHQNSKAYFCEQAERLWREGLSLPCSVGLDTASQDIVCQRISEFFEGSCS